MTHNCFISFKKEDIKYRNKIIERLEYDQIQGKTLDTWIDSDNIDYIMQKIRSDYIQNTSVTIFLIGKHSSENEGFDEQGRNKQSFIIRELKASLYDGKGNRRSGILGIVLPEMEEIIYGSSRNCPTCNQQINVVNISPETVIKEFAENYYLDPDNCGHYDESGRFCVLVRYNDFMENPNLYINKAYDKVDTKINESVHWRDIEHEYSKSNDIG